MLNSSHKKLLLLIVSLTISIITLVSLLALTTTLETYNILAKINPLYLVAAIGMHAVGWLIQGVRLKVMCEFIGGESLPLQKSLKLILASYFAACITPSQFGGEPVRVYMLKQENLTVGDGTAVIFSERALDVVFIVFGAAVSSLLFRTLLAQNIILYAVFTFFGIILCAAIAFMTYGIVNPERVKELIGTLFLKLKVSPKHKRLEELKEKVHQEVDNFYGAMKRFKSEGKSTLVLAFLLTITFWLIDFIIPSVILLGFGADPVWLYSIAAQFILIIIMALPTTPGSSGVAELSFASFYSTLVAAPVLGMFTVTWRLIMYYMNLIAGSTITLKILGEGWRE